ncbi:MAG: hypothetical protein AAF270_02730 [Pseudomonadota bacterium]
MRSRRSFIIVLAVAATLAAFAIALLRSGAQQDLAIDEALATKYPGQTADALERTVVLNDPSDVVMSGNSQDPIEGTAEASIALDSSTIEQSDTRPEQLSRDELAQLRERVFETALLRNLEAFEALAMSSYEQGLKDTEVVSNNQRLLESLTADIMGENETQTAVSCSSDICFVDFFGGHVAARKLFEGFRERSPVGPSFMQSVVFVRQDDQFFRFYLATHDFPAERLLGSDEPPR